MRSCSSSTVAGNGGTYTLSFTYPQREKSQMVRSGDLGGHLQNTWSFCPARPIHLFGKCSLRNARTARCQCGSAPSSWKCSDVSAASCGINPLTPNDDYSGRTAPLTSKRCILYIYSTHIGTEYFKHCIYSPFLSLQNAVCFIILTYLVPVLFTFYIQRVLKLKKKIIPAPNG